MKERKPLLFTLTLLLFLYQSSFCWSQIYNDENSIFSESEYNGRNLQYGLPNYDINTDPISAWFFKKDTTYVGFIIAGHAEKAICEVASLEIANKIEKLGAKDNSMFSFGIGYNFNSDEKQQEKYHDIIIDMKAKFEELAKIHLRQVTVSDVDYEEYISKQELIKSHINLANKSNEWGTHIVEYKLPEYPIITPFYDTKINEEITLSVPKSLFGEIPIELARKSVLKNIITYINDRETELKRLQNLQYSLDNLSFENIASSYPRLNASNRLKYPENENLNEDIKRYLNRLNAYREFDIISIQQTQITGEEDEYGFLHNRQTRTYNKSVVFNEFVSKTYKEDNLKGEFTASVKNKIASLAEQEFGGLDLDNEISKVENDLNNLIDLKREYSNKTNINYIIDAFLRGWAFNTEDDNLNTQLDDWYLSKRKIVWEYILSKTPNLDVNDKLAGVLHADDVFFKVTSEGDFFKITPYKITGGNFAQVIDKEIGISYLTSPLNHRYSKN
ncbi:hypothetical protein GCM10011344_33760 [Dokdonia pacifica]|uniref:Uncharacterized protein n=1 Tax=Dokdonia pacifica TaxID=1627892 RepID=A0A239BCJ8_9FLAO|nr:hypothetical protein [Dokdonia pacifica]GGG30097.1 hypothetical protein GCM10011344_33760 [Dokdonia pacifica]SNS05650.1 hypothetical protein SAMN06265376_10678 [Dokdonia pacifica]